MAADFLMSLLEKNNQPTTNISRVRPVFARFRDSNNSLSQMGSSNTLLPTLFLKPLTVPSKTKKAMYSHGRWPCSKWTAAPQRCPCPSPQTPWVGHFLWQRGPCWSDWIKDTETGRLLWGIQAGPVCSQGSLLGKERGSSGVRFRGGVATAPRLSLEPGKGKEPVPPRASESTRPADPPEAAGLGTPWW